MKLATFTHDGRTRIGVVDGDTVVDLAAAAPDLPSDMLGLLEAGDPALQQAHAAVGDGPRIALADVRLEAPIARVCGADTPFPLAMEKIYLPDELKVYDAIKRTVAY